MEHRFTRQGLYDQVWSKPISHIVAELETTTSALRKLLRHADIPTPPGGYWIRREFGKPTEQIPLPPNPPGCVEPLVLDTEHGVRRKRTDTRRDWSAAREAGPKAPIAAHEASAQIDTKPRPTKPSTLTGEELYSSVWAKPMSRLAEEYGISGNGLAKICDRADIPYPPRGYWAKHAVGKAPSQTPLPKSGSAQSITIRPTPLPRPIIGLPPEVQQQVDKARASDPTLVVPERLLKPHAVIASWLAKHEEKKRRARNERDPWMRNLYDPGDFSKTDRRKHRIMDALFKAIERQGGKVTQGERGALFAEVLGENVEFQVREKQRQERRSLTASERQWPFPGQNDWKQELVPTGFLVVEIRTYLDGLPRQWIENEKKPMEAMLPRILATFLAAGPLLVQERIEREAAKQLRIQAEQRREAERRERKRDANRWRHFSQMADSWQKLGAIRAFIEMLKSMKADPSIHIDGRSIGDWIAWAEDWLHRADPTANGSEGVFKQIAEINDWTYRD